MTTHDEICLRECERIADWLKLEVARWPNGPGKRAVDHYANLIGIRYHANPPMFAFHPAEATP